MCSYPSQDENSKDWELLKSLQERKTSHETHTPTVCHADSPLGSGRGEEHRGGQQRHHLRLCERRG